MKKRESLLLNTHSLTTLATVLQEAMKLRCARNSSSSSSTSYSTHTNTHVQKNTFLVSIKQGRNIASLQEGSDMQQGSFHAHGSFHGRDSSPCRDVHQVEPILLLGKGLGQVTKGGLQHSSGVQYFSEAEHCKLIAQMCRLEARLEEKVQPKGWP